VRVLERNENLKERLAWQEERGGFKRGREKYSKVKIIQ